MSPKFNVTLEFQRHEGVQDPQATTLNSSIDRILSVLFEEKAAGMNVEILQVGKLLSFNVDCDTLEEATTQVEEMIPLAPISNPVMERVVRQAITEVIEEK